MKNKSAYWLSHTPTEKFNLFELAHTQRAISNFVKILTKKDIPVEFFEYNDGDSWVYVLSNESQPGMYKIGYTSHEDVDKRVKQLSRSTSVATPFKLEWAFRCFNAERLEGEVHQALKGHRISKDREFFAISLNEAKETVEDLGQKYI